MEVIKRNGKKEEFKFDKIKKRILAKADGLSVDVDTIAQKVISGMYDGVKTTELDELIAETSAVKAVDHPDYTTLASRIAVSALHKETSTFKNTVIKLYNNKDPKTGEKAPLVSEELYYIVMSNSQFFENIINKELDYSYDYFGFKTLCRSYLLRSEGKIVETPQYMLMRVSIGIHGADYENIEKTYNLLSGGYFTHATPTLFNAGTPRPQMSSCFLVDNKGDSLEELFDTMKNVASISKWSGGIGLSVHNVRAKGSYIKGTGGESDGLVPMLKTYNDVARWINQGGKRKGSFAIYIEPWHADIFDFLDLKKNHGKEEQRARDLFYGLWIPDLFMKRVESSGDWTLMCPNECPGLHEVYGEEFDALYEKYEAEGKGRKTIKAQELWFKILESQIETGTPYMLYKDAANKKSNQKNLGTIKSSNLCTEIIEYTDPNEIAVCNLASLALPKFVTKDGAFDFDKLYEVTYQATVNLNRVIDRNFYPTPETERSNMRHRPIGLGVQGLADAFILMRYAFDTEHARKLNRDIFETIYYAALTASHDLAIKHGSYDTFKGSPASEGLLQFDLWGVEPSDRYDWAELKRKIMHYGLRNSLLLAPMPTASTAQILGNNEAFEPYTSNLYTRRVLAGEFIMVNKHLINDLINLGLWNEGMKQKLMVNNGSVINIPEIPTEIKELYRTVWEIPQKAIIDMSADRGAFICQSQSLNIFMENANFGKLTSMHFYGWKKGLKTGMYYLRTKAATDAIKFTVQKAEEQISCSLDDPEGCESCSG